MISSAAAANPLNSGCGLRTATSALVGISLGENNREKLGIASKLSIVLTVGMMCGISFSRLEILVKK